MRDGQTSPHKPRLVVPHSTCPSLSPSPPAHSFIIGPAVINTHTLGGLQIPRWLGSDHSQRSPIGLVVFGLGSCGFRGNVMIQVEDCRPRRRSWSRFPLTRSCPELLVVGSGTSHLGVLGSIPKREEPLAGKTGAPCVKVPGSSRVPAPPWVPDPLMVGIRVRRENPD